MTSLAFRFVASPELVTAIQELAEQHQVTLSRPQPFDSTSEPLNSPATGGDIVQAAQMVSAVFAAGSAALVFLDKLLTLAKEHRQPIEVRRPGDNRGMLIRPDTESSTIEKTFADV